MNAACNTQSTETAAETTADRIVSIDIFRGLTMALMIFVNALAGVPGLPWWTYHAHANEDVMTYVDMVFPFFLFIVGMALPLSVMQRLKHNPSQARLWLHVVLRTITLVALGLILANAEKADPARMGVSGNVWALFGLLSAALYLNVYPRSRRFPAYSKMLRAIGLTGIILVFAIFRRSVSAGHGEQAAWIDSSYPEILGLIGFSYLATALLYIPTRRWRWSTLLWCALLVVLCISSTAKLTALPTRLPLFAWPFGNGAMACIVMAGVITSQIFLGAGRRPSSRRVMTVALCFGSSMLIAGWICIPLGISKIRATPTWSLWSIAAAILVFTLLFWVCDVKHWTDWAFLIRPAGSNTLLTYLLPDLWYFLLASLGITYLDTHISAGWPAVVKTLVFTLFILTLASALTKAKVRLQL